MRKHFLIASLLTVIFQTMFIYFKNDLLWTLFLTLPIILLGLYEIVQKKHTLMRNYPIVGRARYWMEVLRPKIYQYFIESNTDGTPINRILRSVVYQRAKKDRSTTPFGTQVDVYQSGYEWINHSLFPLPLEAVSTDSLRVKIGGKDCTQPYSCSIYNISAMSFGALSKTAILSLNKGAKKGLFAHNTGEGGVSPYHRENGGDLIWQIGTGYFGCRDEEGNFNEDKFSQTANLESVKMIEVKLSQGAKPGHGGILPADKNTEEIAEIRGVRPHTTIFSPSSHSAFKDSKEMMNFIKKLRTLSNGKPIGIKLCFGNLFDFENLCQEMVNTGVAPDYIAIDGGEGGTGAAPLEFTNSIGTSLREGIVLSSDTLRKFGLRDEVKIFASGKIISGFDIIKAISLGADACYSARGMMLALGCIQALECNTNNCPTGVATQNKMLYSGIDITDKGNRVHNFHHATLESVAEILAATGLESTKQLNRSHIWRRIDETKILNYEQIYPYYKDKSKTKSA